MKKELTLLIMAAGAGSRFGGLKQIEPFGPNGEFIIDYSIYDALRAGFTKVVFVIKKENEKIFKETIGKRIGEKIKVEYVFQSIDDLPHDFKAHEERVKPFGTGQAILSARFSIKEPFGVINADDFYGSDSYVKLAEFLKNTKDNNYATICFPVKETISQIGSVKRGIVFSVNNLLKNIIECSVENINNQIKAFPLDNQSSFDVDDNMLASVNMFGFTPDLFPYLESKFTKFLKTNEKELTTEFLLPEAFGEGIKEKFCAMEVIASNSSWMGITYKEDVPEIKEKIKRLIDENEYPSNLWNIEN